MMFFRLQGWLVEEEEAVWKIQPPFSDMPFWFHLYHQRQISINWKVLSIFIRTFTRVGWDSKKFIKSRFNWHFYEVLFSSDFSKKKKIVTLFAVAIVNVESLWKTRHRDGARLQKKKFGGLGRSLQKKKTRLVASTWSWLLTALHWNRMLPFLLVTT